MTTRIPQILEAFDAGEVIFAGDALRQEFLVAFWRKIFDNCLLTGVVPGRHNGIRNNSNYETWQLPHGDDIASCRNRQCRHAHFWWHGQRDMGCRRFAEVRFAVQRAKLEKSATSSRRGSRLDEPAAYHAEGILYLSAEARFD